mgnify:CR=1 FL=1
MAKAYPQTLWDAIRAYWENNPSASYADAANAVSKGEDVPSKPVIFRRAKAEGWQKRAIPNAKERGNDEGGNGNAGGNGSSQALPSKKSLVTARAEGGKDKRKKTDEGNACDRLADVINANRYLSKDEIDEVCEDLRLSVLERHRNDFEGIDEVVNNCVSIFRKTVSLLAEGGVIVEGSVIGKDGFVYDGLVQSLKLANLAISTMLNASIVKTNKQNNERKAYGLDTYEEPNSGGDLAKKAMSQEYMAGHYERIRLSKVGEREAAINKLKEAVNGAV